MAANEPAKFYAGTSNVVVPVPNKQAYPAEFQDKTRLTYYSSLFNSVEVNSTFYKLPLARTVEKWSAEVPGNFRFTFKLWQEITHQKGGGFKVEHVGRFMQIINQAADKKGCLLVQFPPSVSLNPVMLNTLLEEIKVHDEDATWKIAVEFRNKSWYNDVVYQLLDQHKAAMVLHDLPASAAPIQDSDADFVYLRFHGPNGGYRGSYEDDFLYEYASYIKDWINDGKTVYAYFNNTMGAAVHNLITLNEFVNNEG
jgi:uncharacterized protein YecE (DUF72 family)